MFRLIKYILVCASILYCSSLVAQADGVNYDFLMLRLEADLKLGKSRSLRDLGSVLSQDKQKLRIHQLLKDYTLFLPEEYDLSKDINKEHFLEFYYENAEKFKFSELLNAFYLTALEYRDPDFSLQAFDAATSTDRALLLRTLILNYEKALSEKDEPLIDDILQRIAAQGSAEALEYLADVLNDDIIKGKSFPERKKHAKKIAAAIVDLPTQKTLDILLQCLDLKLLEPAFTATLLANLTNHLPKQTESAALLIKEYQSRTDSLGGFEKIREAGYSEIYSFNKNFFEFPVDYYGRVLSLSEQRPWLQHNALKDVIATQHPRALFYIASQIYQYRDRLDIDKSQFVKQLEALTELKISVRGNDNKKSIEHNWNSDRKAQINYVSYWASHYEDYEWDDIRGQFINKTEQLELTQNYERLFRRLNSTNDSVATQAWLLLSEGDPIEVVSLAEKYKELLRNYNKKLPSFKYRYLEKTVQLTDYCKRNTIHYQPAAKVAYWLERLENIDSEKERYHIENRIINTLSPDEITAVEYWGLLHENNKAAAFSVGRILDWFYSENWDKIISSDTHLRLYLKKSTLFAEIGVIGVCNHYMNKFGRLYPQLEERLKNLLRVETDEDIITAIEFLLFNKQKDNHAILHAFFESPSDLNKAEIAKLPPPNQEDFSILFEKIKENQRKSARRMLFSYLQKHLTLNQVPQLFDLLQNETAEKQVVSALDKLYNHFFEDKKQAWLACWEQDGRNYKKWEKKFFSERVKTIASATEVNIRDLNAVLKSSFYEESTHKTLILTALPRLNNVKHLRRLRVNPLLQMPEDLVYFENLNLSEKELDDIPRLFELSEPQLMVTFLTNKIQDADIEAKGFFFNNLFRANWFADYVNSGNIPEETSENIRTVLDSYLHDSKLISEFEEQATIRNMALLEISHLPLEEKITALLRLQTEIGEEASQKVQKVILASIDYEDIHRVTAFFQDLSVLEHYNFLNKDFGLPLFNLSTPTVQKELREIHKKFVDNPPSFYEYYLEKFGVDYKDASGSLDYAKVYRILKYDIVTPFVGDGGNRRDYFTFAVIKLLENKFETRLDFHPKLNENQTFYSFSAAKRANAWMDYLEKQSLVSLVNKSKSFNWTRVD